MLKMPATIYFVTTTCRLIEGPYFSGDFTEDLDDALDQACDLKGDFRIFHMDFDPDTNMPETARDVTEDALIQRNALLAARGSDPLFATVQEREAFEERTAA